MNLFRPRLGVGTKTMMAMTIIFWVPVSVLAGLLFYMFEGLVEEEVSVQAETYLQATAGVFEERGLLLRGGMRQLAGRFDVQQAFAAGDDHRLQDMLLEFGRSNAFVTILSAVDTDQRVIARRNERKGDVFSLGSILPSALTSGEPAYSTELVSRDLLMQEETELASQVSDLGLVQYLVMPVHKDGKVVGALVSGILLSADTWLGNAVYSRFGVEMALFAGAPRQLLTLHATTSQPRSIWLPNLVLPPTVSGRTSLGKPYAGRLEVGGQKVVAAFKPVMDGNNRIIGAIGVATPFTGVSGMVIKTLGQGVGITAIIGLLIALLLTIMVHHDINRPLAKLVKAMNRFGDGELGMRVELKTGDQMEELGKGFNSMADGICKREERFMKHNEVAKLFMSTLDMEDLLDKTLRIVVGITESQMGVLYLWEEEAQRLVPHAQYGTSVNLPAVAMGEGLPGRAAKDQTTLEVKPAEPMLETTVEMGFMQLMPGQVVYIPLVYQSVTLGVLVLGCMKEYQEDEFQLFDHLADQISIALDNAKMHQRVRELSITDGLTGLCNRRYLNARLEQEWARSVRQGQPLSILLSDVDNFKSVNDQYGHDKGDEVLREVANIFKQSGRKEDITARYGGEEFVVVLINTSIENARIVAQRICDKAREVDYPWMDRGATLSIGVASFPDLQVEDYEALLQAADQAMYKAKMSGKDKVVLYEDEVMP